MFDQRYNCVSQDKHGKFFVLLSRISNENSSNNAAFNRSLKNVFEESDENKNRRKTQFMHHKEHYDRVFNGLLISV